MTLGREYIMRVRVPKGDDQGQTTRRLRAAIKCLKRTFNLTLVEFRPAKSNPNEVK